MKFGQLYAENAQSATTNERAQVRLVMCVCVRACMHIVQRHAREDDDDDGRRAHDGVQNIPNSGGGARRDAGAGARGGCRGRAMRARGVGDALTRACGRVRGV